MSTPIKREDIQAGDRVRSTHEFTAGNDWLSMADDASTYELIERPVALPTVPGFYLDKDGDMWKLTGPYPRWRCLGAGTYDYRADEYAPFTPMRKAPEVAAEVCAEILAEFVRPGGGSTTWDNDVRVVAARWAAK